MKRKRREIKPMIDMEHQIQQLELAKLQAESDKRKSQFLEKHPSGQHEWQPWNCGCTYGCSSCGLHFECKVCGELSASESEPKFDVEPPMLLTDRVRKSGNVRKKFGTEFDVDVLSATKVRIHQHGVTLGYAKITRSSWRVSVCSPNARDAQGKSAMTPEELPVDPDDDQHADAAAWDAPTGAAQFKCMQCDLDFPISRKHAIILTDTVGTKTEFECCPGCSEMLRQASRAKRGAHHDGILVTLFCDASVDHAHGDAGWAGWAKSTRGKVEGSGAFRGRAESSNHAELMAIANMLHLAIKRGHVRPMDTVLIETDSDTAIKVLQRKTRNASATLTDVAETIWRVARANSLTLRYKHVKGHTRNGEARHWVNNLVDVRARAHMRKARADRQNQIREQRLKEKAVAETSDAPMTKTRFIPSYENGRLTGILASPQTEETMRIVQEYLERHAAESRNPNKEMMRSDLETDNINDIEPWLG